MPITKCVECGKEISITAKVCPHCGKKDPTVSTKAKAIMLLVVASLVILYIAFSGEDKPKSKPTAQQASTHSVRTESPAVTTKKKVMGELELDFSWSKGGFKNVMIADFTITNPTDYSVKDIEITCTHFGPSGTRIDSNTRTIYDRIPPKTTKTFDDFNMGIIHSQSAGSSCKITGITIE